MIITVVHRCDATSGLARRPTATTRAPVHMDPMLSMSTSFFVSFVTLPCFSPPCTLHGGFDAAVWSGWTWRRTSYPTHVKTVGHLRQLS